jgi:TonB family protein
MNHTRAIRPGLTIAVAAALLSPAAAAQTSQGEPSGTHSYTIQGPGKPGVWITDADYPFAALRAGESGIVRFRLDISVEGRVMGCTITASSGSALLDSTTCRLLRRRALFAPAVGEDGIRRPASYSGQYEWRLPE